MAKYRQAARELKPLIFMIIREDSSNNIGQGPAQNPLQVRKSIIILLAIETNNEQVIALRHTEL